MNPELPRAWGPPPGRARLRRRPEDFQVTELPAFEPEGEGEHAFLYLEKRELNTLDLVQRIARLSGVPRRDLGYSGLKDRNAVTRQWFSARLAGREEPDWTALEASGDVKVLRVARHRRKLRRGTHRGNRFRVVLRELEGDPGALRDRLAQVARCGAPNYFGEQRFGRGGATLAQAMRWADSGRGSGRSGRVSRERRGFYLSALRAHLFNRMLAARVEAGVWNALRAGDVCMLAGSRSFFVFDGADETVATRLDAGDLHPGLPLWGSDEDRTSAALPPALPAGSEQLGTFLQDAGVALSWRPTRLLPDDFSWQFCDDDSLQLEFILGAGSYATALLSELVWYGSGAAGVDRKGGVNSGAGGEQG